MTERAPRAPGGQRFELPPQVQIAQAVADIAETYASVREKDARSRKTNMEVALAPLAI